MIRSPSNLELLLHCYCSGEPHPRLNAPAIRAGILFLVDHDMITAVPDKADVYQPTDRGHAYIEHLMKLPFPQKYWVIENAPPPRRPYDPSTAGSLGSMPDGGEG